MSNYNYDGQFDGDWEDRGDVSWNEFDWQQYLKRQDKEVARFSALYADSCLEDGHLDEVARKMGWEISEWAATDPDFDDESSQREGEEGEPIDMDPYTLHRHPVYVASSAIHAQLRYGMEILLSRNAALVETRALWSFGNALNGSERHILLALQSVDMGDFLLAVVHLKLAMREINTALGLLPTVCEHLAGYEEFHLQVNTRLFDLREICLRMLADCREEDRRGFPEEN